MQLKFWLRQFIFGIITGALITGLFMLPEETNKFLDSIQKITLILGSIFTAYWTSITFTYNPKRDEAKELIENIRNFLEKLSSYESMKPLMDSLAEENFINDDSKKHFKERSRKIERETNIARNLLHESLLSSNYVSKVNAIFLAGKLPVVLSQLKTKSDFDNLRKELWHYDYEIRKESFFTINDSFQKFKNYFKF